MTSSPNVLMQWSAHSFILKSYISHIVLTYNLEYFKWKRKTIDYHPSPQFPNKKKGGLQLARGFIIDFGGDGGSNFSFYFVQDCRYKGCATLVYCDTGCVDINSFSK